MMTLVRSCGILLIFQDWFCSS